MAPPAKLDELSTMQAPYQAFDAVMKLNLPQSWDGREIHRGCSLDYSRDVVFARKVNVAIRERRGSRGDRTPIVRPTFPGDERRENHGAAPSQANYEL